MESIKLTDTPSTNAFLLEALEKDITLPNGQKAKDWEGAVVSAYQSAGRGMGSNTWESESGKNLLYSILIHPTWLPAMKQYLISMSQAVAVQEVLSEYTDGITIKWPNDIYWHDKKISGTLIEGNIQGRNMCDMIIGTGININQQRFFSDAPNPVSLLNIIGQETSLDVILQQFLSRFSHHYTTLAREMYSIYSNINPSFTPSIIEKYHSLLYRRNGFHMYEDANGPFMAEIKEVATNGILTLSLPDGELREYEFKEVKFIIPD